MTEKEAYGLLELRPGASDDAVKKAYRRLAQKVHPDKGGSAALFRQVREAYEFLTRQGSSRSANAEYADGAEERRKREAERRRKTEEQRRRSEEEQRKRREEERRRAEEAKKKKDKEAKKKAAFEDYYERRRKAFSSWEILKWSLVWGHFDRVDQKFEAERQELARRFGEAPRGRADETESWQTRLKKKNALLTILSVLLMFLILSPNPSTPPQVAEEPGSLVLELSPSDARVILPDIELRYRRDMELPAGEYQIIVRKPGHKEFTGTVRIESGERTTRSIALVSDWRKMASEWRKSHNLYCFASCVPSAGASAGFEDCVSRCQQSAWLRPGDGWLRPGDGRARGAGRAVGTVFRDPLKSGGKGPEMVVLPTGSFRMGSPPGETGRDSDEGPVRTVNISRRIAMGRYEVTFAEYDRFVAATSGRRPNDFLGRGSRPVIDVSQEDAKAYAAWLSEQTGKTYRLPSEAEWEYAARSGTRTRYSWGDEINCLQARYGWGPFTGECSKTIDGMRTVAVGRFEPNAFGLFDMHGNASEWVEDCYHDNYDNALTDGRARTTNCDDSRRAVVRGGSWLTIPKGLRAAFRYGNSPSDRNNTVGFRLVQDLNPSAPPPEVEASGSLELELAPSGSRVAGRAVGEVFRDALKDGGEGPEMVVLPTGSFRMGSPATEEGRWDKEGPVRTVNISRRLAMGRYEVTFADYDRFVTATGRESPDDEGWGRSSRPVINVSQEDAKAYAAWLSAQTGKTYRLPSEAEWEYAARSGTRTRYSWGDSIGCDQARYGRREGGECSDSYDGTVPVGSFAANGFGLFDMHGNVSEWVADCSHDNYEGAPTDGSAWTSGCVYGLAVVRGGSWYFSPRSLRSADRSWGRPSGRDASLGFRLVQDLNP